MYEAIIALVGALIGAGASILGMHIQQRNQNRRDLVKLATEIAIDDYNRRLKIAEDQGLSISFPPIAAFVAYQIRVLEEMSSGVFDVEKIKKISKEQGNYSAKKIEKVLDTVFLIFSHSQPSSHLRQHAHLCRGTEAR